MKKMSLACLLGRYIKPDAYEIACSKRHFGFQHFSTQIIEIMEKEIKELIVTSSAFNNEGEIPAKYTCDGDEVSPPINVEETPEGTKTLAIIMEDPDAPNGTFTHWLLWNIDPKSAYLDEQTFQSVSGTNSANQIGYYGPCPPSGSHRYYFHVYALDDGLDLEEGADRSELELAIEAHVLGKGSIMGRYKKQK